MLFSFFLFIFNQAVQRQKGVERCYLTILISVTSWKLKAMHVFFFFFDDTGAKCFFLCLGRLLPKTYGLLYVGSYDQPFAEIKVRNWNVLLR